MKVERLAIGFAALLAAGGLVAGSGFFVDGAGNVVGTSFAGDGSQLTNLDPMQIAGAVPVEIGGTGATSVEEARENLGVPSSEHSHPFSASGSVVVVGEALMTALTDVYSISEGAGVLERNRLPMPRAARLRNLYLITDSQPAPGASLQACLNVNGVDTSVCAEYSEADWPAATGSSTFVDVMAGDLVSVHYSELSGVAALASARASFQIDPEPSPQP